MELETDLSGSGPSRDRALVCTDEFRHAREAAELRGLGFSPRTDYTKSDFWG